MTTEQSFFIKMLADHLWKRKTQAPEEKLNWAELIKLSKIHELSGILYAQCKDFVPSEYSEKLFSQYASTLYYYENRINDEIALKNSFLSNNIPCFTIKGSAIAAYYPVPALRTMGDTDLVVHSDDRPKAHEIMVSLGFDNHSKYADREWVYYKDKMEYELHDNLIYNESVNLDKIENYLRTFWDYEDDGKLDDTFHFIFILTHLRKHLMNIGVGFRHFYDIAVLTKNNPNIDWEKAKAKLQELDLWVFAERVFALNKTWFNVNPPIEIATIDEEFLNEATDAIFKNGIFGFNNEDNKGSHAVNELRNSNNRTLSSIANAVRTTFPSYKTLITDDRYRFIKNRPYLLPFAWAYRIIRGICRNRTKVGINAVKKNFISEEAYSKRESWLEKWGL